MKYQKLMKKIMEQLGEYKGIIDNLSICYLADKKEAKFATKNPGAHMRYMKRYSKERGG